MDEATKNRVQAKLAKYFVEKEFMRHMGFENDLLSTKEELQEMEQIQRRTGVTKKEIEEFARSLRSEELERYNFKNR